MYSHYPIVRETAISSYNPQGTTKNIDLTHRTRRVDFDGKRPIGRDALRNPRSFNMRRSITLI